MSADHKSKRHLLACSSSHQISPGRPLNKLGNKDAGKCSLHSWNWGTHSGWRVLSTGLGKLHRLTLLALRVTCVQLSSLLTHICLHTTKTHGFFLTSSIFLHLFSAPINHSHCFRKPEFLHNKPSISSLYYHPNFPQGEVLQRERKFLVRAALLHKIRKQN